MPTRKIFFYGGLGTTLAGLILSNAIYLDVSKTVYTIAHIFELEHDLLLTDANTKVIGAVLKNYNYFKEAYLINCK